MGCSPVNLIFLTILLGVWFCPLSVVADDFWRFFYKALKKGVPSRTKVGQNSLWFYRMVRMPVPTGTSSSLPEKCFGMPDSAFSR